MGKFDMKLVLVGSSQVITLALQLSNSVSPGGLHNFCDLPD